MSNKGLDIIVIGQKGALRNPHLESQIQEYTVRYVSPVRVTDATSVESEWARDANRNILGRELLNTEIGCALAHEGARALIESEWALILEDDADLPRETLLWIVDSLLNKRFKNPTIITLFERNSSQKRLELRRLRHMPGGAVAYLASKSTSNLDKSRESRIGTADWPFSFIGARFYRLGGSGVTEHEVPSTIDESNIRPQNPRAFYINALYKSAQVFKQLGFAGVKYGLFLPAIRDLSNRTIQRNIGGKIQASLGIWRKT
jgi:GR25 family glycosyltransferase involved in LPS biosynthesis